MILKISNRGKLNLNAEDPKSTRNSELPSGIEIRFEQYWNGVDFPWNISGANTNTVKRNIPK